MSVFPGSRCQDCRFMREVKAARSTFLLCTEGSLPKYPPQPVRACGAYAMHDPAHARHSPRDGEDPRRK